LKLLKMKKVLMLVAMIMVLAVPMAYAHGNQNEGDNEDKNISRNEVTIQINGVDVVSSANYLIKDKAYVDVKQYAKLIHKPYTYQEKQNAIIINNKQVSVQKRSGMLTASVQDLATATGAEKVSSFQAENLVYVLDLPDGVIQTPLVPGMGEHWFRPQDNPIGPIYGVHEGKLVFIEQMISQKDFTDGTGHVNIDGMRGLPSPAIVHSDVEFQAHGHEGFEVPHFDIHHYFVTHEEHLKY
jgi:hypothetical protein